MEVNQLRNIFGWASAAANNGSDCNGVLMYLFQEVLVVGFEVGVLLLG